MCKVAQVETRTAEVRVGWVELRVLLFVSASPTPAHGSRSGEGFSDSILLKLKLVLSDKSELNM